MVVTRPSVSNVWHLMTDWSLYCTLSKERVPRDSHVSVSNIEWHFMTDWSLYCNLYVKDGCRETLCIKYMTFYDRLVFILHSVLRMDATRPFVSVSNFVWHFMTDWSLYYTLCVKDGCHETLCNKGMTSYDWLVFILHFVLRMGATRPSVCVSNAV